MAPAELPVAATPQVVMIAYQVTMLVLFGLFYIASYLSGGEKRATRKDVAPATAEKKDS